MGADGERRHAETLAAALATIDFAQPGRRLFKLVVPDGAGHELQWPLAVFNRGKGPTLLLTAGVHGDEFEGPALLVELVQSFDLDRLRGRLIVAPAMNPPALAARTRRSPLDGLDLNRSFPGDDAGSVTQRIAAAISRHLVPLADAVYDLHAGGAAEFIVPSVMIHPRESAARTAASFAAMRAFDAPVSLVIREAGAASMLDGEVERQGKIFGCVELGSVASLRGETLDIGRRGIANLLRHLGMLRDAAAATAPEFRSRLLTALEGDHEVRAAHDGYFVPGSEIGDVVSRGDRIGILQSPLDLDRLPFAVRAPRPGVVYIRAAGGPVRAGDTLAVIADAAEHAQQIGTRLDLPES